MTAFLSRYWHFACRFRQIADVDTSVSAADTSARIRPRAVRFGQRYARSWYARAASSHSQESDAGMVR